MATLQPAQCEMCPGTDGGMMTMGWVGMVLGVLLIGAIIATLVSLTIFLVRRSHGV